MGIINHWLGKFSRSLHMLAAIWLFLLAFLILADVVGRGVFNTPIQGTAELVANSIVAIAFLQLSHSIRMGGMLRAEFLDAYLPVRLMRTFSMLGYLAAVALFIAIAYASWEPMLRAWEIKEYQGDGALRVPTYPVRMIIVATSILSALSYVALFMRGLNGEHGGAIDDVPVRVLEVAGTPAGATVAEGTGTGSPSAGAPSTREAGR